MGRLRMGLLVVAMALGISFGAVSPALSVQGELPIGVPETPRRVRAELPATRSERKMKWGPFQLHPSLQTRLEHDDNIFLANAGEKGDWVFTQVPTIQTDVKMGDHHFEAAYGAEIVNLANNHEENTVNHLANALLDLVFNNLNVTLSHALEDTTSRTFNETSARDHLRVNESQVLARYDRPRWAAETGWTHDIIDHRTILFDIDDFHEDIFTVLAGYKFLPKTLWLVEADEGLISYDRNVSESDQTYLQLFTGIRGDLTPKLAVLVKVGRQDRKMKDAPALGPQSGFKGIVANMDLQYKPREKSAFRASYVRTVRNSTFGTNNWYTQDRGSLSFEQRFWRKWLVTPTLGLQYHRYPDVATSGGVTKDHRRDLLYLASAELRYEMRDWLSTGFKYEFRARNSNLDALDFNNSRVSLDITAVF